MNPPTALRTDGDAAANWTTWKQKFLDYLTINSIPLDSDKACALLRVYIGENALEIYRTFELKGDDLNVVLEKFDAHFIGTLTQRRVDFFRCKQTSGQSVDEFVESTKKLASQCRWGELEEELVRLMVINGFGDRATTRLLMAQGKGRSLTDAVAFLKTADEVRKMYSDGAEESTAGAKPKQRTRTRRNNAKVGEKESPDYSKSNAKVGGKEPPVYSATNTKTGVKEPPIYSPTNAKASVKEPPAYSATNTIAGVKEPPIYSQTNAKASVKEPPAYSTTNEKPGVKVPPAYRPVVPPRPLSHPTTVHGQTAPAHIGLEARPKPPPYTARTARPRPTEEFVYVSESIPRTNFPQMQEQAKSQQRKKKDSDCVVA